MQNLLYAYQGMKTKLPSPQDLDRSSILEQKICREIEANQGMLGFEKYMQLCLYADNLGYYASGRTIFGEQGDFVTSSEQSTLYAQTFVAHLQKLASQFDRFNIVEVGAGSGRFASQFLTHAASSGLAIQQYYIVEKSAGLRERQQQCITSEVPIQRSLVQWVDGLATPLNNAVVIVNEVIDALPVCLLTIKNKQIYQRCVMRNHKQEFAYTDKPAEQTLAAIVRETLADTPIFNLPYTYHTEICVLLPNFIEQIATLVQQGIFFFIDYGYPRQEYYHEQRSMGTLLCHYDNVAHDNPLVWPGLQDISSNVDFTALADAGVQAGLELNTYTTQAHFLLASDLLAKLGSPTNEHQLLQNSQELKRLMLPSEMGERFQVMVFTKHTQLRRDQFSTRDLSHRL